MHNLFSIVTFSHSKWKGLSYFNKIFAQMRKIMVTTETKISIVTKQNIFREAISEIPQ